MIRLEASLISNKDLIGLLGWSDMRARDKLQRGRLRLGDKLPLENNMTNDETQETWH